MKSLADNLKAARRAAGLTQADVAARCGWETPSRYANYEQGSREPTLADLRDIAAAVAEGGHTFVRIVTGEDLVPASQPQRIDPETIRTIINGLRKGYSSSTGWDLDLSSDDGVELLADALAEHLAGVHQGEGDDERVQDGGSVSRLGRTKGAKEAGKEGKPTSSRNRKSA